MFIPTLRRTRSRQCIILLCGPPCSGKSDISRELLRVPEFTGYARCEMDEVRLALTPQSHTGADRANAYAQMHQWAAESLSGGAPGVILVATYQPAQQRRFLQVLAGRFAADVYVFECAVAPDAAVQRFKDRTALHAGIDLWPERVWDLAQEFPYFPGAVHLDTTNRRAYESVSKIRRALKQRGCARDVEAWVEYGNPSPTGLGQPEQPAGARGQRLTAKSRSVASTRWRQRKWSYGASLTAASAAIIVLAKKLIDNFWPGAREFGFTGDPGTWIQSLAALSVLAFGLYQLYQYLFESPEGHLIKETRDAGSVAKLDLRVASPSNREIYERYRRRIRDDQLDRMPMRDMPLWFVIPAHEHEFAVDITWMDKREDLDSELLRSRAARLGLDWDGYKSWREKQIRDEYYDPYHRRGVRVLNVQPHGDRVEVTACESDYVAYVYTELSANLSMEGRSGFEMRQVFEGAAWMRSNRANRDLRIDLFDIPGASKTYEMLLSVQVGLTTADGFLIVQRRSEYTRSAAGGMASSAAGAAQRSDLRKGFHSLVETALRETKEELGWTPGESDLLEREKVWLGAGFSLLRGRDINFYCHLHTAKTLAEISRTVRQASDRWEVAQLLPIPVCAVELSGTLSPPFDAVLGDARHLRGLLYCLARSDSFKAIQRMFPSS